MKQLQRMKISVPASMEAQAQENLAREMSKLCSNRGRRSAGR